MADAGLFYECFLCKRPFQFGRYVYEGNYIAEWGLNVCHKCRADSWNGIDPAKYPHAESVLKYRSVPFRLNSKGRIDIPTGCSPQPLPKSDGSRR
jgi:hypothetical protein